MSTTSPSLPAKLPEAQVSKEHYKDIDKNFFLVADLINKLPREIRPLSVEEEERIAEILSARFGIRVVPMLQGKRLNRTYGLIGQEQHLSRYPGDTIDTHFTFPEEAGKFSVYGMAPGLGAWRYFSPSRDAMTQKDIDRERYYIAVQIFLSPGFYDNVHEYVDFFKYRKMLVVNPQNGRAVVTIIGDVGPAEWTGKHLGGSPEVMTYLQRKDGSQVGPVLYFFIDDPLDHVPLGPIYIQ
jgi:hypothetical protein